MINFHNLSRVKPRYIEDVRFTEKIPQKLPMKFTMETALRFKMYNKLTSSNKKLPWKYKNWSTEWNPNFKVKSKYLIELQAFRKSYFDSTHLQLVYKPLNPQDLSINILIQFIFSPKKKVQFIQTIEEENTVEEQIAQAQACATLGQRIKNPQDPKKQLMVWLLEVCCIYIYRVEANPLAHFFFCNYLHDSFPWSLTCPITLYWRCWSADNIPQEHPMNTKLWDIRWKSNWKAPIKNCLDNIRTDQINIH